MSMLTFLPPPSLNIPSTRTATAQAQLYHEANQAAPRTNPHKHHHLQAQARANIQPRLASQHVLKDAKHDSRNDARHYYQQSRHEREDR